MPVPSGASGIIIIPGPRPGVFFTQALSPAIDPVVSGHIWDEFLSGGVADGSVGSLGWNLGLATVTYGYGEGDHVGAARVTSFGAGNIGRLYLNASNIPSELIIPRSMIATWIYQLSGPATAVVRRIGMSDHFGNNPPGAGVYLEHLSGETTWYAVVRNSSLVPAQVRVDTNIAVDGLWHKLRTVANAITGQIDFYIDGDLKASIDYTITAGWLLEPGLHVIPDGAATRYLTADLFEMRFTLQR